MPDILAKPPGRRRKVLTATACRTCRALIRWFHDDPIWTENGNTEGRCPNCGSVTHIGRFGLTDTYA